MELYFTLIVNFVAALFVLWVLQPKWYSSRVLWGWTIIAAVLLLYYFATLTAIMVIAGALALGYADTIRKQSC